ncbi:MAG: prepilin peptidase, partial [Candidatus Doudnabacteria bacterium]|nr:prepilin peptidase [Candidatus Doudnabacteria bacterium]
MELIFSLIFGLIVGSFLNVVINRLRIGKSVNGRSICPNCKHKLAPLDLVPVFSFIFLGGKCRYCGKPISWQYPVVEILTGITFMCLASRAGSINIDLVFQVVIASFFIVIAVYDLKHFLILDKVILPGIVIATIYAIYQSFGNP